MEAEEDETVKNSNEPSLNDSTATQAAADMRTQEDSENCEPEPELDRSRIAESRISPPPQPSSQLAEEEGGDAVIEEEDEAVNDVAAESQLGQEGSDSDELRLPEEEEEEEVPSTVVGKFGDEDSIGMQESREVETLANELAAESRLGEDESGSDELRPPEAASLMAGNPGCEDLIAGEETKAMQPTVEEGPQPVGTGEKDNMESVEKEENQDVVDSFNSPTPLEPAAAGYDKEDEDVVGEDLSQMVEPNMETKTKELISEEKKVVDVGQKFDVVKEMDIPDVVDDAEKVNEKDMIDGDSSLAVEPKRETTMVDNLEENKVSDEMQKCNVVEKIGVLEEAVKAEKGEVPHMAEENEELKEVEKMEKNEKKEVSKVAVEGQVTDLAEKFESEVADVAGGMEAVEETRDVVEEVQLGGRETAVAVRKEEMAKMEDAEMAAMAQDVDNVETEEKEIAEETEMDDVAEETVEGQESATEVAEVADEMVVKPVVEELEMMEESEMVDVAEETDTAVEETEVTEETEVEEASRSAGGKRKRSKIAKAPVRVPVRKKTEEDVCFICFDGGDLVLCDRR